jgi:hypothetical protein
MMRDVHAKIGDFGVAVLLAEQWSVSAQAQDGQSQAMIESKDGRRQQACFTGAWAKAAGSTAFEQVAAFRVGLLSDNGERECATYSS